MFGGVSGFKTSGGWLLSWQRHKASTATLSPWFWLSVIAYWFINQFKCVFDKSVSLRSHLVLP